MHYQEGKQSRTKFLWTAETTQTFLEIGIWGENVDSCQSVFLLVLQAIVKSNTPMQVLSYYIVVS